MFTDFPHPAQLTNGVVLMKADVRARLVQMNNHFGRGHVAVVDFEGAGDQAECHFPCIGIVTRLFPVSQVCKQEETRRFRVDENGTLFFLSHQSKLGQPMKL